VIFLLPPSMISLCRSRILGLTVEHSITVNPYKDAVYVDRRLAEPASRAFFIQHRDALRWIAGVSDSEVQRVVHAHLAQAVRATKCIRTAASVERVQAAACDLTTCLPILSGSRVPE
jgi:hypothetical protein